MRPPACNEWVMSRGRVPALRRAGDPRPRSCGNPLKLTWGADRAGGEGGRRIVLSDLPGGGGAAEAALGSTTRLQGRRSQKTDQTASQSILADDNPWKLRVSFCVLMTQVQIAVGTATFPPLLVVSVTVEPV